MTNREKCDKILYTTMTKNPKARGSQRIGGGEMPITDGFQWGSLPSRRAEPVVSRCVRMAALKPRRLLPTECAELRRR